MKRLFVFAFLTLWAAACLAGDKPVSSHAQYFEHYEGTKTCLQCHRQDAENFFHSQHYQWEGKAPDIVNADGRRLGKMNTVNDFCTNPRVNWIGNVKNSRGEVITKGCSACHAGSGKLPSEKMTEDQLENIDCLMCHANGYRRDLYPDGKGGWVWKPILWQNQVGMDSVAKRISLPTRIMCLRCHSASGGGANYKRGDIEYVLADTTRDYDVHMGTNGANMQCIACHKGQDHRVRGRGTDLSGTDMPSAPLSCSTKECHGDAPHKLAVLDKHAERISCTVCHIPDFARTDATDMYRDWSKPAYNAEADKYSATITLEKDVKPVYAWYNGTTREQFMGQPVHKLADGTIGMMIPMGSKADPHSKIFAFKLHRAKLPVLDGKDYIIPIEVEQFFASGNIDEAVKAAAKATYHVDDAKYTWMPTTRYMGIFHGVQPKEKALQCLDCHGKNGRMDWKALGYGQDPLAVLMSAHK